MNRKLLSGSGLVVLLLAACGGGSNSSSGAEQVTLRYAGWNLGTVASNNIERQMLAAYEVDNPHVNIEII